ncbi:hypothetical protein [Corynebacterium comes]|uniref:Uncharacterized protein n=1 Tax=Corynebacterium comes TaxID=2675218 RepID=A0A6B8VWW8_9CORY|nr:hypothetical protein [Corynebacterium comes]QGU04217.1 hypothetical protein CETAM_04730 [Corynebacterium comes]
MKKSWVLIPAVASVSLTGCGSLEPSTALTVTVSGHSDQVSRERGGQERCSYFDGWLSSGDRVLLRDSEGEILGVSDLRAHEPFRDSSQGPGGTTVVCSWEASFQDVPANRLAYTLEVADFGEVALSRESIGQGEVSLRPRSAMGVLAGEDVLFAVH